MTRQIPWLRVGVEGVVIVGSILLAFGVQAWWDVRQERSHLDAVLAGLEEGYVEHLALLDENIEYVSADQERLRRFIEMDPAGAARIPPDQTWSTLESIWRPGTSDDNITFLLAALQDESLKSVREPSLQRAIASWQAQVDELRERVGQMVATEHEALRSLARHPDVTLALASPAEAETVGIAVFSAAQDTRTLHVELSGEVMRRVRSDPDVMSIAGMKAFLSRIHIMTLRDLRAAADSVLDILRQLESGAQVP